MDKNSWISILPARSLEMFPSWLTITNYLQIRNKRQCYTASFGAALLLAHVSWPLAILLARNCLPLAPAPAPFGLTASLPLLLPHTFTLYGR